MNSVTVRAMATYTCSTATMHVANGMASTVGTVYGYRDRHCHGYSQGHVYSHSFGAIYSYGDSYDNGNECC